MQKERWRVAISGEIKYTTTRQAVGKILLSAASVRFRNKSLFNAGPVSHSFCSLLRAYRVRQPVTATRHC